MKALHILMLLAIIFASSSSIVESKKTLILGDPENNHAYKMGLVNEVAVVSAGASAQKLWSSSTTPVYTLQSGLSSTSLEFVDVQSSSEPFVQSSLQTIMDVAAAAYPQYKTRMRFYAQREANTLVYPDYWQRMKANINFRSADSFLESLVNGQKYLPEATFIDEFGNQIVLVVTADTLLNGINSGYLVWGFKFTPQGVIELPPIEITHQRLGQMTFFQGVGRSPGPVARY